MAYIKTLKENELYGGKDNNTIYPVTTTQAVFSQDKTGNIPEGVEYKLEDRLQEDENKVKALDKKVTDNSDDIQTLQDKCTEVVKSINQLITSKNTFAQDIADIRKVNEQQDEKLSELDEKVVQLNTEVTQQGKGIKDNADAITGLKEKCTGVLKDIKDIKSKLDSSQKCECNPICKLDLDKVISGEYPTPTIDWCGHEGELPDTCGCESLTEQEILDIIGGNQTENNEPKTDCSCEAYTEQEVEDMLK